MKGQILFYGSMNERRERLLQALRKRYKSRLVCAKAHGAKLEKLIRESDIVVNLHFYPHASLEIARINEALRNGRKVVTERGIPIDEAVTKSMYPPGAVRFVPVVHDNLDNIDALYRSIDETLQDPGFYAQQALEDVHLARLEKELQHLRFRGREVLEKTL